MGVLFLLSLSVSHQISCLFSLVGAQWETEGQSSRVPGRLFLEAWAGGLSGALESRGRSMISRFHTPLPPTPTSEILIQSFWVGRRSWHLFF